MVVGAFIPVDYVDYDCRGFDARLIGACSDVPHCVYPGTGHCVLF